ncbi:hypothetical protein [Novosphingobium beihaiensis]|uniref:Aerotolerance regulator N-terminal domain-containing protein n=1 Tax=Novosphingobium beihaiensis TaxID=2930389 RepID=A0ABT0BL67_9SPHN|nr:hypothetical protein [Novosphingobium beihaiensis]MCJ2185795.1 hypothetical protein [Novosphingobium beihaiensis]
MTFAGLSPLVLAIGAPVLAAILFALQQLRVRHKTVRLPAAMLWAQAAREAPARSLRERFRYWQTFLLALAIALLLWLGASLPRFGGTGEAGFHIFYLDNSAVLSGRGSFAAARAALLADVAAIPDGRREVRLGDAQGTLLLARGENVALLAHRLGTVSAQARPSGFANWAPHVPDGAVLHYYGGPSALDAAASAPKGVMVSYGYLAPAVPDNRGIVNLGLVPAASGDWTKADLLVETLAADGSPVPPSDLVFTRAGKPFHPRNLQPLSHNRLLLRGLDADGSVVRAALKHGDDFPADDSAAIHLPSRGPIGVALAPDVPRGIRSVVEADPALYPAPPGKARVLIRRAQDKPGTALPELVLTDAASGSDSFLLAWPGEDSAADPAPQLAATGLSGIDTGALADSLHRRVTLGLKPAEHRSVSVWNEIIAQPDFRHSSAMPLFVSRSLRWLAGPQPWLPFAKAGAPVPEGTAPGLRPLVPGGETVLPAAGEARIGTLPVQVSLLDRATTLGAAHKAEEPISHPSGTLPADWPFFLICLAAGLLLAFEWRLYRRGQMP